MSDRKKKQKLEDATSSSPSSSSPSTSSDSDHSSKRRHRHRKERRRRSDVRSQRERERRREKDEKRRRKKRDRKKSGRNRERKERKMRREGKKKKRNYDSDEISEDGFDSSSSGSEEEERLRVEPETVVREMMEEFPNVGNDLKQLLQMIDDGQAVDIKGISERLLMKRLKKLFLSLNLEENGDRVFLLPSKVRPTLEVVGPLIHAYIGSGKEQLDTSAAMTETHSVPTDMRNEKMVDDPEAPSAGPQRRMIGPAMPSAELLAAAAKLTEAQAELREAEVADDGELFIGPPPPAMVTEAESANEAERFEEVTRIMEAEADSPYDILGVNHNMSTDNIKKRYWKISLLVHPDKCSHPLAHQAFIKINKAFKELQDPDKRKAMDDKIKQKQEQEDLKAEFKAMREAALWRRSQGISMEGDDVLLAETEVKEELKRDEWMTTLPPERKPGMPTQTTKFSRSSKEGRGDTSAWTDTPSDRAQKAKMNYLEAYNEATALASNDEAKKRASEDAELVDKYNKAKRSKSLVQKHQEELTGKSKKKSKRKQEAEKEDWVGDHPWKPWDREKDLTAGRKSVRLDPESMGEGLSSRFSAGTFQRNFL
ncbi:DNA ligase 1 [Neltuma alba]|uniref:DNA ligase 1 n=1 Tax=Neltuma alba TaxID=207710 RepID=UPI0010A36324|nr:DNA ligase 1 [Prosopis alba]